MNRFIKAGLIFYVISTIALILEVTYRAKEVRNYLNGGSPLLPLLLAIYCAMSLALVVLGLSLNYKRLLYVK